MPNRILREGILTSPRMAKLGWPEEVFYRRLMSVVDDFGRYYAEPGMLRAACYPRQLGKVADSDVVKWTRNLAEAGLVSLYPAEDGERYLELLDFRQQVRAKESRFPPPPSTCAADATQPLANAHLDVDVDVDDKPARKGPTPLPNPFPISDSVRKWAKAKGFDRLEARLEHFVGYVTAHGKRYSDWDAAFMNAIRGDWAKLPVSVAPGARKVAM